MDTKEKGALGEAIVYQEIVSVVNELDFECEVIKNARFPFESVYGEHGYITAEIDVVVFTPYLIFLFEVKNERYKEFNYKEPLWYLMNDEPVSNLIEQNHTHKEVFCSELKIPREQVITIEVLLENGRVPNVLSIYPNDYVFSSDDLKNKLIYLLATTASKKINKDDIYQQFVDKLEKENISEEEHIKHLKRTEKIETRIKNVIGYVNLRRTDVVHCTCCGVGKLYFKDKIYPSTRESKRASKHYFLACSSYGDRKINCRARLIYVDKNKDSSLFKEIATDSIIHRNNWGDEGVTKTILNEIESLNCANQKLCIELQSVKKENERLRKALAEVNKKNDSQAIEIKKLSIETMQVSMLKEKLGCFKKILGRIYFLKD